MSVQGSFGSGGEVVFNLRVDISQAAHDVESLNASFKQLESIALRYIVLARRLGLPEEADALIQKISMMVMAINQLRILLATTKAELVAAGPIGWLALGASAAYTALSFYSLGNQ